MKHNQRIIRTGGLCGIIGIVLYIALAIADPYIGPETKTTQEFLTVWGSDRYIAINMALHFLLAAAAILWLVAFLGLHHLLDSGQSRFAARLGTLFGVVACAIMVQMMVVQGSVMGKMGRTFLSATNDSERQTAVALYRGLRYIDYGMDLAFDTFIFSAWILLGYSMLRHRTFGRIFGSAGIILFALAAVFNLQAAPDPPAFDVGPIGALWALAVYIQMLRKAETPLEVQATESVA